MPTEGPRDDATRAVFVYAVAGSEEEAERIATRLLQKRLVACANWFPVQSKYWWRGKIESAGEVALVMKTTQGRVRDAVREIRKAHSYEVPTIVGFRIDEGYAPYLEWIRAETRPETPRRTVTRRSRGRARRAR